MSHSCFWSKLLLESTPGTLVRPSPVRNRRAPPRKPQVRRLAPPPARPFFQNRPIRGQRIRLDPVSIRSEPLDPDPSAWIHAYRFSLGILLKRPPAFRISTRSPCLCKYIYRSAQIFTGNPLTFPDFKPAVQPGSFCELDPELVFNCVLVLGFSRKVPGTLFLLQISP